MKSKMRFLQRVKRSRTRLRDAAALELAAADIERRRRLDEYSRSADELEHAVGSAAERLGRVANANQLLAFGDEVEALRHAVRLAQQGYAAANREVQGKSNTLHERERELRASEKLMERLAKETAKKLDRDEQRSADDLSSARRAKGGVGD